MGKSNVVEHLAVAAAMVLASASPAAAADPLKIGLSLPLTGGSANYFQEQVLNPILLARDEENAAGGMLGRKVEYVIEDNKGDAATGASIARKLIELDKVEMLLVGSTASLLATLPIADDHKMIVMTLSEHPKATSSPWAFRCAVPGAAYGRVSAEFAYKTLGARTAGILGEDNDATRSTDDEFTKDFQAMGGKVLVTEGFKTADQDLRAQLTHLKASDPELLLIESPGSRAYGLAIKQSAELNFMPKYRLGREEVTVKESLDMAGDLAKGFYYLGVTMDPNWNDKLFKPRFGYDGTSYAATSYDCIRIYALAVKRAGTTDPTKVRDTLVHLDDYVGALGKWGYAGSGEPKMNLSISQIK